MTNKKIFIILIFLFISCIAFFSIRSFCLYSDSESDKIYRQGIEFYNKADYQNAYYNFKKIPIFSSYSAPALYRQAMCAWELKDNKTAISKYSKFAKTFKNTNFAPEALWKLALLELDKKNKKKANHYFNKLIEEYPESDFAKAASYQLGFFYYMHNDLEKAKKYLVEYLEYAPFGRYSLDAINLLHNWDENELSDSDKIFIAESLRQNSKYTESIKLLDKVPIKQSWVILAKNYDGLNNNAAFCQTVINGTTYNLDKELYSEKEILDTMLLYLKKSGLPVKEAAYNLIISTKNNNLYPLSLFIFSKYVDYDSALKNYHKIYSDYPNSIVAPDALWFVFWNYYKNKDFKNALKISKMHSKVYFDYNIQPKILFWTAKIYIKANNKKAAKSLLQNIVYNYPASYYAFRANAILKKNKAPWKADKAAKIKKNIKAENIPISQDKKEYWLLSKFAILDDYVAIQNFKFDDDFLNSWLAAKNGNRMHSALLAREALLKNTKEPFSSPKYKLAYPLYYDKAINKYATHYNLSPYLILSLIKEESAFNNKAISSVGAMGLMQLMPPTARLMDSSLTNNEALFDAEYNISLGTKYFAHLMKIFNGNEALCVLAYNSGPNAVKNWLNKSKNNDFDEFVENVPYSETANYIKKVYASYWSYMNIYEKGI